MTLPTTASAPKVTLDACFVIGYCAKEQNKYAKAKDQLEQYAKDGWEFFAPGVLIAESLYVFCRKKLEGSLTQDEYDKAVQSLDALMKAVKPPPSGDASLIVRAEQIRVNYGCGRSADSIYLALAEILTTLGTAELVTFDGGMDNQAKANVPSVKVNLLTV
jgi:predicted nucleic acid-binding protein